MIASLPGLYIHIPFCLSRCGYCAFISGIYEETLADAYLAALKAEWIAREAENMRFGTIFIGGGTPSCLSMKQLETLLALLPKAGKTAEVETEATCEINPDTATKEKLRLLAEAGINRVSFGVQTFSPEGLRLLDRRHDARTAIRAVEWAHEIGFPKGISIDLINEWPGQTDALLQSDIAAATSLPVQHISYYNFILEEQAKNYTVYSSYEQDGEDELAKRYWEIIEENLENKGFIHYETSNFSQPGFQCRHNTAIWKGGEYLGLGVAAHSHMQGRRFANCDDIRKYISGYATTNADPSAMEAFSERLEGEAKARECAVFWLRLFEGVHLAEFAEKTGYDFRDLYKHELPGLLRDGIMETTPAPTPTRIRVAKQYHPLLDMILTDLV